MIIFNLILLIFKNVSQRKCNNKEIKQILISSVDVMSNFIRVGENTNKIIERYIEKKPDDIDRG